MIAIQVPDTYLNQDGLLAQVGDYIQPLAKRVLIITSPTAWRHTAATLEASLRQHGLHYRTLFLEGYCTEESIAALREQAHIERAELILGVGGGKVLDTAKAVADQSGALPMIAVPTVAATCAAWSPISVLYSRDGVHQGRLSLRRLPVWVLVDSTVIARAPVRYLKAGIVDALAKWYEFQPYLRHGDDALSLHINARIARLAVDIFDADGEQALADNQRQQATPALRRVIDAVIALAGIANSVKDERARLGVAHAIHNSLTRQPESKRWLHGEKVGFGLAVQVQLEARHGFDSQELLTQLRRYDSPQTPQALGLTDEARWDLVAAQVTIPADVAARLPFAVDRSALRQALAATVQPATTEAH